MRGVNNLEEGTLPHRGVYLARNVLHFARMSHSSKIQTIFFKGILNRIPPYMTAHTCHSIVQTTCVTLSCLIFKLYIFTMTMEIRQHLLRKSVLHPHFL